MNSDTEFDGLRYPSLKGSVNPYPFYDHLLERCPVHAEPGSSPARYLVVKPEDVRHVLAHPEIFSSVGKMPGTPIGVGHSNTMMLSLDPPAHKSARDIGFAPFKPVRLREHEDFIHGEVNELINGFIDDGAAEFVGQFAAPLSAYVTVGILGLPTRELSDMYALAANATAGTGLPYLPPERQQVDGQNYATMRKFVLDALVDRRDAPREDALTDMITFQRERDGELDIEYVAEQALVVLLGGIVTTAHALGNILVLLLEQPEYFDQMRKDRDLVPKIIEESLRIESPSQWGWRRVAEDTELRGVTLEAGSHVLVMWGAAHRDKETFDEPDRFCPERSNLRDHLAFGYGKHFCLGAPLARLEMRIALEQLIDRLHNIRLDPARPAPAVVENPNFRSHDSIWILFDKRK